MKTLRNKNTGSTALKGLTIVMGGVASVGVANATNTTAHADTIKAKDNTDLKSIAKEKHVDVVDLAKANKVDKDHKVDKGDKIKLPSKYTVKKGDTVSGVAQKLDLNTQKLLDANKMTWNNATIHVGDKLDLPDAKENKNKKPAKTTQPQQAVQQTKAQAPNSSSIVANAVQLAHENIPYVWGGESLSGFDCSGLVQYLERMNGVSVGRTTVAQEANTIKKPVSQAQPGDLLFWGAQGGSYHVAIYIGNGQYVHAPAPGQNVTIGSISAFPPSFAGTVR